jgi:hypothetical protein
MGLCGVGRRRTPQCRRCSFGFSGHVAAFIVCGCILTRKPTKRPPTETVRPAVPLSKKKGAVIGRAAGEPYRPLKRLSQVCDPRVNLMEYRGIRYTLRAGIERGQWFVVIYPEGAETKSNKVFGTREEAEVHAHRMINRWLDPKSRERTRLER